MKNFFQQIKSIGYLPIIFLIGYLMNPFNFGFVFGYIILIFLVFKRDLLKKNMDTEFIFLLGFSLIYGLFYALNPIQGIQWLFLYIALPGAFYLLGKHIQSKVKSDENTFITLILIGLVFSLPALISVMGNILDKGFGQINRSIAMFWDPNGPLIPATIMGSYFTLNMGIPALLFSRPKKVGFFIKILVPVVFILSLACIIRIGTRTQLVITLLTIFSALVYIVPRQSFKKNIFMFAVFFGAVALLISNIELDFNADWLSAFADRMDNKNNGDIASGGGRTQRWVKSFEYLFKKPLGWDVQEFGHSHNLWLDVLRVSGVIAFTLLVIFTIKALSLVKKAYTRIKETHFLNNQIRVYTLAFLMIFMVEPIFEGMFRVFVVFCLFIGMLKQYLVERPKSS